MRTRIVACLLTFILTVGAICPLVEVKADAPIPYTQTELYVGTILANLFATGYAIDISGDMVSDILAPAPDSNGFMSDAQYNDFMKQYAKTKGFISYDPDTDIGVYEVDEYFDIDNGIQFTTGIVSERQQDYIVDYLQKVRTGELTGTEKLYIPFGVKDWYKSYGVNQGMAVTEDGETYVSPILDYTGINYIPVLIWQSNEEHPWALTANGTDTLENAVIYTSSTYSDTNGVYHGALAYFADPNLLPSSPTSLYTSNLTNNLYTRDCFVRLIEPIDILIPATGNSFYDTSHTNIEFTEMANESISGNYLYGHFRASSLNGYTENADPEIERYIDGVHYTSYARCDRLVSSYQFQGPIEPSFYDLGYVADFGWNISIDGSGVDSPNALVSKLSEYLCGNVNIYIGDTWADAVPLDGGIADSISLDRDAGVRVGYVPDNATHDGFIDITAFIDWYRQWLLSHADGGTLTMDTAITDGGVIVDEDDDDDTLPAPIGLDKVLSRILQQLLTKAKEEELEDEITDDDDGFLGLDPLPDHEALHSKLWSLPIKNSDGITESASPVDAALGITKVFVSFTHGFLPYLVAIVVLIIWVAIVVTFLHT